MLIFLFLLLFAEPSFAERPAQRDGQAKPQAWFVKAPDSGNEFVHICAIAPTVEEAHEIAWQAHTAHGYWNRYFFRDGTLRKREPEEPIFREFARVNETCDGTEDLTIYYGMETDAVREVKKLYDNPLAFAHLDAYDETTGAGKGFIWIARAPEVIFHAHHRFALIVHEMGHAFGHDHIEGTIMDENISEILSDAYKRKVPFSPDGAVMTNGEPVPESWIDLRREASAWSVIHLRAVKEEMKEGSERDRALTLLTGEKVRGAYELRFLDKFSWRDESDNYTDTGKGIFGVLGNTCINPSVFTTGIWHAPCMWQFKVVYGPKVDLPMGDQQLYRRVFRGKVYSRPLLSSMQTGYFADTHGKKTNFVISRNMGEKLDLSLLIDGEKIRLY